MNALTTCASCHQPLSDQSAFCPSCGASTGIVPDDGATLDRLESMLDGRYGVEALVGSGPFGRVFRATDRAVERTVAIKACPVADPDRFVPLRRSGPARPTLRHPNIVPRLDTRVADGFVFLVMSFLDGGNLDERLDAGAIAAADAHAILSDIAHALDAAHRNGVVHGGLKPTNVLFEKTSRRVLVSDFGTARAFGNQSETIDVPLGIGVPEYMSPEACRSAEPVDPAGDIYTFGVIAYELFTGRVPFSGDTAAGIMMQHLSASPTPLVPNKTVSREAAHLVMKCLEKDAKRRPDAGMLVEVLSV